MTAHTTGLPDVCPVRTTFRRPVIVVDTETTGLDAEWHIPVEVAWWNLSTNERGVFVPSHDTSWVLEYGDPKALEINQYRERLADALQDTDGRCAQILEDQLADNTMAGSSPEFDDAFLKKIIVVRRHRRLWSLGAYAAGKLNLDYVPGLADVCERLGIKAPDHTAAGDVTSTGRALLTLRSM